MLRKVIPLLLISSLGAFAQFGGIGLPGGISLPGGTYPGGTYPGGTYPGGTYPGGTYPGGTYPGGQIPGGQIPGGQIPGGQIPAGIPGSGRTMPGMNQMLEGNLRQISPVDLAIETSDSRIIQMRLAQNARLYSTFGSARISDFDPGDFVTVQATADLNGNFQANTVTMERKGTPEERRTASQPLNTSMHAGNNGNSQSGKANDPPNDSSDSDRPVLRRAGSASDSDNTSSPSASNDDGRPRMHRADSASSDSNNSAPVQTARATPMPGDPGPPTMRRGAAPRDQAASDSSGDSTPSRPSVRATEVNGVTQLPAAPPQVANDRLPSPSGTYATDDPIIDKTRETAFEFTESLPDYIVKQFTTRYQSDSSSRGKTSWQPMDLVSADVVMENGKETYKNLMVNGKATKDVDKTGSWSEGEFASTMQAILSPASDALFTNKRSTTIVNRPAYRYDYSIEQPRSSWQVYAGGSRFRPAYGGAIWIDKETSRVLRLEMSARNIPKEFPLDQVESAVDYDFVLIGSKKYLLPTHSEALSCQRGTTECSRNVIEFRNYKKYGADSNITFEDPVK